MEFAVVVATVVAAAVVVGRLGVLPVVECKSACVAVCVGACTRVIDRVEGSRLALPACSHYHHCQPETPAAFHPLTLFS